MTVSPSPSVQSANPIEEFVGYVEQLTATLANAQDLSPQNPIVSPLLSGLVHRVVHNIYTPHATEILERLAQKGLLKTTPALCSQSEVEMEVWWSQKISNSAQPKETLESFWYYKSYQSLCQAELDLIQQESFERIVFLGAGPLPVSAILYAKAFGKKVIAVDNNPTAVALAQKLINALDLPLVEVCHHNAESFALRPTDLPVYASLLRGSHLYHEALQARCKALLVRDSQCLTQVLYAPAQKPPACFKHVSHTAPQPLLHINTTQLYKHV